jgi:hypothetical protein
MNTINGLHGLRTRSASFWNGAFRGTQAPRGVGDKGLPATVAPSSLKAVAATLKPASVLGQSSISRPTPGVLDLNIDSAKTPAVEPQSGKSGHDTAPLGNDDVLKALRAAFGSTTGDKNFNKDVDFDKDGEITIGDLAIYSKSQAGTAPDELQLLKDAFGTSKGDQKFNEKVDFNHDDQIDIGDYSIFSQRKERESRMAADLAALNKAYGTTSSDKNFNKAYDLDGDGEISIGDYSLLSQKYA